MPIRFKCGKCAKVYQVDDSYAGRRSKCKACGNVLTVPTPQPTTPAPTPEPAQDEGGALLSALSGLEAAAPDAEGPQLQTLQIPEKPKKPKRPRQGMSKSTKKLIVAGVVGCVVLGVLGVIGLVVYSIGQQYERFDEPPVRMTLREFFENGPPEHGYIEITNFKIDEDDEYYAEVYQDTATGQELEWTKAAIALYADDANLRRPDNLRLMLYTDEVRSEADLLRLVERATLVGTIKPFTRSVTGFNPEPAERMMLVHNDKPRFVRKKDPEARVSGR